VAVVGFGDATIETGVFHESLNFASLKKLPVIFVCENNQFATYTHIRQRQPDAPIYKRAEGYGMKGVLADGMDAVAVYHAAQEAVARARSGAGPTLLECGVYRWRDHVGPDYDYKLGHRTKEELDQWMARCPIKKIESSGAVSGAAAEDLRERFTHEMDEAVKFAKESPVPTL
jgi:pyruvate dehydrogenase E1 component alpha subunit